MHIPDGFFNAATSVGGGAGAFAMLGASVKQAARTLDERRAPLAGLVAAYVFAAQMLNFPVGAGTSGHMFGAVLAAVLVGPWTGVICVAVVVVVQALFADGGLTALGLNILLISIVPGLTGYAIFSGVHRVLPRSRGGVLAAAAVAAWASVVISAAVFSGLFAVGGTVDLSPVAVTTAMVGVHAFIGVGEAAITVLTLGAVLSVRPDLVYGARRLLPRREWVEVAA